VGQPQAATFFRAAVTCRARGATPTAFDVLMCALAVRHVLTIFTTDTDFTH
jgi:predicted nucleic acid-binding protein